MNHIINNDGVGNCVQKFSGEHMKPVNETIPDVRDVLLALLEELASDEKYEKRFNAAPRELHEFFWMMKKDHARSGFVSELLFDTNGNYPYSEQLDQILQQFQLCGVLSRPNPTYKYNDISISPGPSNQQLRGSLSPEQQGAYRLMADDFKEKLGVPAKAKQR